MESTYNYYKFVLVHGVGHGAWCWYKVVARLQAAGHTATPIDLTSNGINKVEAGSVATLAHYAQPLTEYLEQQQGKVILVGHSLGGSVISYAMELFPEKIHKAVFVAALMPKNGESVLAKDLLDPLVTEKVLLIKYSTTTTPAAVFFNPAIAPALLYFASPPEDVALALAALNPTPYAPLLETLSLSPDKYGSVRRFYISAPDDQALTVQASIIQNNPPAQVYPLPGSDHSPFFSKPDELTQLLMSIATSSTPSIQTS